MLNLEMQVFVLKSEKEAAFEYPKEHLAQRNVYNDFFSYFDIFYK